MEGLEASETASEYVCVHLDAHGVCPSACPRTQLARPKDDAEAQRGEAERWRGHAEAEEAHAAELVANQLRLQVDGDPAEMRRVVRKS